MQWDPTEHNCPWCDEKLRINEHDIISCTECTYRTTKQRFHEEHT